MELVVGAVLVAGVIWLVMRLNRKADDAPPSTADVEAAIARAAAGARRDTPSWQGARSARLPSQDQSDHGIVVFRRVVETSLIIDYRDSAGAASTRRIAIYKVGQTEEGHWMLRSWCHERDGWRSFRSDRIVSLSFMTRGETAANPIEALIEVGILPPGETLRGQYHAMEPELLITPKQKLRQDLAAFAADLDVLVLVARADGKRTGTETKVIFAYLASVGIAAEDKLLRDVLGDLRPEPSELNELLAEVGKSGRLKLVVEASLRLIEADGKITDGEKEIAASLRRAIEAP